MSINSYLRFTKKEYKKYKTTPINNKAINTVKNLIKLQYNELSSALQFTIDPKCPKIPEPNIPPFDCSVNELLEYELLPDLAICLIIYINIIFI
jgi:hypothetical protein